MKKTEITVQVFEDLNSIISKLKSKGFKQVDKFELDDWYFSCLSKQNSNVKQDYNTLIKNSFLVRRVVDEKEKFSIIYKNKTFDEQNNVVSEEKLELPINDFKSAIKIFKSARLNNWCNLKQLNLEYKNNEMDFLVQIVEDVGIYIEYEETETMKNLTTQQKIELMHSQLKSLGLNLGDDIFCKKVYIKYLKNFNR